MKSLYIPLNTLVFVLMVTAEPEWCSPDDITASHVEAVAYSREHVLNYKHLHDARSVTARL